MTTATVTTARHGDPMAASRGASVALAKAELGSLLYDAVADEFWTKKRIEWLNHLEFTRLGKVLRVSASEARKWMKTATLGELREAIAKVNAEASK
jgi:hypothetical protein